MLIAIKKDKSVYILLTCAEKFLLEFWRCMNDVKIQKQVRDVTLQSILAMHVRVLHHAYSYIHHWELCNRSSSLGSSFMITYGLKLRPALNDDAEIGICKEVSARFRADSWTYLGIRHAVRLEDYSQKWFQALVESRRDFRMKVSLHNHPVDICSRVHLLSSGYEANFCLRRPPFRRRVVKWR